MRVAVCFYGINRSLSLTFPSIQSCIYEPLQQLGIEFDVFTALMHPKQGFSNPRSHEKDCSTEIESVNLLRSKSMVFLDQEDFDSKVDYASYALTPERDQYNDGHASSRNIFRAMFSLKCAYGLSEKSGAYDYYLFLRPDLLYQDVVDFSKYLRPDAEASQDALYTPAWGQWGGLNDRMAIAGRRAAWVYGQRFDHIRIFLETTQEPLNPEKMLLFVALLQRLDYASFLSERTTRIRSNMTYIQEAYIEGQLDRDTEARYAQQVAQLHRGLQSLTGA